MNEWVLRFFHLNVWPLLLVGPSLTNIARAMPRVIFGHLIPVSTTDQVHGALEWAESDSTMDYREVCADGRSSGLNSRHTDGSFSKKRINALSYPKTLVFNSINEPNRHCIYQCTAHYCRCNCFCIYELPTEQTWNPTGTPQLHKSSRKVATVFLLFTEDFFVSSLMSDLILLYFMLLVLNVLLS